MPRTTVPTGPRVSESTVGGPRQIVTGVPPAESCKRLSADSSSCRHISARLTHRRPLLTIIASCTQTNPQPGSSLNLQLARADCANHRIMSSPLLHPPAHLPPSLALHLSQQAPLLLQSSSSPSASAQLLAQLYSPESPETWTIYQNLFLSCLRTRDDRSARLCLDKLTERFGPLNEHVMGLKGMYDEAVATDNDALDKILKEYESKLAEDPTNMVRLMIAP